MEELSGEAGAKEAQTASTTATACSTGGMLSSTTCYGESTLRAAALPGTKQAQGHACAFIG